MAFLFPLFFCTQLSELEASEYHFNSDRQTVASQGLGARIVCSSAVDKGTLSVENLITVIKPFKSLPAKSRIVSAILNVIAKIFVPPKSFVDVS